MTDSGTAEATEIAIATCGQGDITGSQGMGLPPDLVEHIICKLPLWELARVSTTCRSFQETFTRQVHTEQQARSDLALELFGHGRIVGIAGLIERCFEGETMESTVDGHGWMSADGELHIDGQGDSHESRVAIHERGDVCVFFRPEHGRCPALLRISWGRSYSIVNVSIRQRQSVVIDLWPSSDEDLEGVALVQVLLSDGPTIRFDGHPVTIRIKWWMWMLSGGGRPCNSISREEALQFQSAPLMPLVSQTRVPGGFGSLSFLWK